MASDVALIPDARQTPAIISGSQRPKPAASQLRQCGREKKTRPKPSAAPVKCIFISIVVFNTMLFRIVGSFICMSIVTFNRVFSLLSGWTLLMWHNKLELTMPRLRTKPEHLRLFVNSSNTKQRERALVESANRREQELRTSAQQREREMQLQISTLQSQLTLLQHQNRPEQPIPTNGADVASCISELRAGLHAIKSVVAATPPPASASATASVWQMPPGTGSRSSRAHSHDVPQPAFPIAPSVGRQPSAPSPIHHAPPSSDPSDSESSDGSWSPSRGPRPPPGPPSSGPSAPGSIANSSPSRKSQGIGSTGVVEEADIYCNKDLSLVKIDS